MAKDKKTTDDARRHGSDERGRVKREATRYKRSKSHTAATRRRLVAKLRALGHAVPEIVEALASTPGAVRRDIACLRRQAARRQLAADPAACAPLFLEEAEDVVRKVRQAQSGPGVANDSTLYLNLLKLEWAMLIKLVEITRSEAAARAAEPGDDPFADLSKYSNEELLEQGRAMGLDVSGFERALRLMPDKAA